MNVRGLKAFLAVVECESVTEAGNRVGLTQSGVSRQIAALEDEVGFALFDRHRGRLRLSRKGQAFMRHARNALETLEQLPQAARTIATGAADRLEIAATSAVVHGLLPRVVANYIQLRPGLPPSIVMRSLNQIIELGPTDRFDLVILPSPLRPTALTLLGTISFDLQLAAPHHLVPELCADQPLEDVAGLPFISLDPFETYQESVEQALAAARTQVRYVCETTSVIAAARMVELGIGCAFVDPFVAASLDRSSCSISTAVPRIPHRYGFFSRGLSPPGSELSIFVSLIAAAARALGCTTDLDA